METIAFLGCSRGLGREVLLRFSEEESCRMLLFSRDEKALDELSSQAQGDTRVIPWDFSNRDSMDALLDLLAKENISRVFYFAGGGPHGEFSKKNWKDHQWALDVSFLFPMKMLHGLSSQDHFKNFHQFVAVGSVIADSSPDPLASSYSASKHGLKGLFDSLTEEPHGLDIRFFRPGYMDTKLLPPNSKPRRAGLPLLSPEEASRFFKDWVLSPEAHKTFTCS